MNEWGNETVVLALKEGGDREKLEERPGKLHTETGRSYSFLRFDFPHFMKPRTQSFPHLRVNRLRDFTKPALWNGRRSSSSIKKSILTHYALIILPFLSCWFICNVLCFFGNPWMSFRIPLGVPLQSGIECGPTSCCSTGRQWEWGEGAECCWYSMPPAGPNPCVR